MIVFSVAVPDGFVTVSDPVFAFAGTVTVSFTIEFTLNFAGTPWKVTDVVPLRFVPLIVSVAPRFTFAGVVFAIVGTGAVRGRKPSLTKIAWPPGLRIFATQAWAADWFALFAITHIE